MIENHLSFKGKNCLQDMGLNDGSLSSDQVHLTSVFDQQFLKYGNTALLLDSYTGWKPQRNSIQEYIKVGEIVYLSCFSLIYFIRLTSERGGI